MKIVGLAFALLLFNFCMSAAVHAQMTDYPIYYESEYLNEFDPEGGSLPENISTVSEAEQYPTTMNIVDLILGVTDFGWLYSLVPDDLDDAAAPYIMGLQGIVGFLYAVAIIELFVKRSNLLGSSDD